MLIHVKKDGKVVEVVEGDSVDVYCSELRIRRHTGWGIFGDIRTIAVFSKGTWDCAVPLIPEPVK